MSRRVHKIHSGLQWGSAAPTTGAGRADRRRGRGWRFHPARQADPEMLSQDLVLGDHEFDLEYVRLGMRADTDRARVHISAYHPDFLFVAEDQQLQVALNVLYWALGEDDVARWIGEVTIATEAPIDSLAPSVLPVVVEQVAEPFAEPAWLTGEGRPRAGTPPGSAPGSRCTARTTRSATCTWRSPSRTPTATPTGCRSSRRRALRAFEKKLTKLGDRAVLAVRETGDGLRVFHLYADPDSGVISELDQLAAGWPEGKAKVASTADPAWKASRPTSPSGSRRPCASGPRRRSRGRRSGRRRRRPPGPRRLRGCWRTRGGRRPGRGPSPGRR